MFKVQIIKRRLSANPAKGFAQTAMWTKAGWQVCEGGFLHESSELISLTNRELDSGWACQ